MLEVVLPLAIGLASAALVVGVRALIRNRLDVVRPMRRSRDDKSAWEAPGPARPFEPRPVPAVRPGRVTSPTAETGRRPGRVLLTWMVMLLLVAAAVVVAVVLVVQGGRLPAIGSATDAPTPEGTLATSSPDASPSPSATPVPSPTGAPALARSSIGAAVQLNSRLLAAREALAAELAQPSPRTGVIAGQLRDLVADAARGVELVPAIGSWAPAKAHADELGASYGAVLAAARKGLEASVSNAEAYRASGAAMVELLGAVAALDATTRDVAVSAGVPLPSSGPPAEAP